MGSRRWAWKLLRGSVLAGGLVLAGQTQTVNPGYRLPPIRDDFSAPYPMNYTDEAAQTLGISHGEIEILSARPRRDQGFQLRGGIDRGIPKLQLQWPSN